MWSKWCLLLARTDLQSERHRGLSMMVIDMEAPGIDRREIVMSNGSREFAEVYLDGVEVPSANVVGRPGDGWAIAMGLLTYERGPADMGWVGRYKRALADASVWLERQLPEIASGNRERLAAAFVELNVMEWHVKRSLARRKIAPPGPESSVDKLLATRVQQGLYRTLLEVWGNGGLVDASLFGSLYAFPSAVHLRGDAADPAQHRGAAGAADAPQLTIKRAHQVRLTLGSSFQGLPRHGSTSFGNPRTRSAMSVLFTSVVPPLMEFARLRNRRLDFGRQRAGIVVGIAVPGHVISPTPSNSAAISCTRWFRSAPCTFPTELSGPGGRPDASRARMRSLVQALTRSSHQRRVILCLTSVSAHP